MRSGPVLMLFLSLGVAGCSKTEKPGPVATETSTLAPSPVAIEAAATSSAAPLPTASASTAVTPIVSPNVRALGTEPFWNAQIDGDALTYTTPEDQKGRRTTVARRDTEIGAVFSGKLGDEPLVLTLAKRTCSDGMSDRAHPFSAVLVLGSQRLTGCAS